MRELGVQIGNSGLLRTTPPLFQLKAGALRNYLAHIPQASTENKSLGIGQ